MSARGARSSVSSRCIKAELVAPESSVTTSVTSIGPGAAYTLLVTFCVVAVVPSPRSHAHDTILESSQPLPVSVTACPVVGRPVDGTMATVGTAFVRTVTDLARVVTSPPSSVAVTVTSYAPATAKACVAVQPATPPLPSPKSQTHVGVTAPSSLTPAVKGTADLETSLDVDGDQLTRGGRSGDTVTDRVTVSVAPAASVTDSSTT